MSRNRYSRQLSLPEVGEEGQRRLREAKVLLVGVGGLGSPISLYLTGAGIGKLGLVDDDVVSVSNLQRQVLYSEAEVDSPKVLCAARRLRALNSEVEIVPYPFRITKENAEELIDRYDIVVDGCDNFATRYLLNDTCLSLGKPYVYGAIQGLNGQVSVFGYGDPPRNYRDLYPDEEETLRMPPPDKSVIGVTPAIVGSVEASETIKLICGYGEPLAGKLWSIDLRDLSSYVLSI